MSEIASASINTFGTSPKADFESPSEEAVFILNSGQLQEIITKALQPLRDEVRVLKATVACQDEKIAALEARIGLQEDNGLIQLRLISQLREATKKEITPGIKDRGDILRALLAANGGKMLLSSARQKMHLRKDQFSQMLTTMKDEIEVKPLHSDKRKMIIILKSKLV